MNKLPITVVGNLTAAPELRYTPSGKAVANFRIAYTPRTYDSQTRQWQDGEAIFFNCSAWAPLAENVAESLSKGAQVIVYGTLSERSYTTRDGRQGVSKEIQVEEVGPSLRFVTAQLARAQRQQSQPQSGYEPPLPPQQSQGGFNAPPPQDPWSQPAAQPPSPQQAQQNAAQGLGGAQSDEPPF